MKERQRCETGKVKYFVKHKAVADLNRLAPHATGCGYGLNVYICDTCKCWHVGHKPGSGKVLHQLRRRERR